MSDKETAPWMKKAAAEIWRRFAATFPEVEPASEIGFDKPIAQIIAKHAVECTAQAPTQRWISVKDELPRPQQFVIAYYGEDDMEITWHTGEIWEPSEPDNPTHWQPLPLGPDGATTQGTPTEDGETGIWTYLNNHEAMLADIFTRLNKIEGATPQGTPDTQWIKPKFPAATPEEWREFGKTLTTPDKCPTCGALHKKMWYPPFAEHVCADPWHQTTGLFPPNSSKNWQNP